MGKSSSRPGPIISSLLMRQKLPLAVPWFAGVTVAPLDRTIFAIHRLYMRYRFFSCATTSMMSKKILESLRAARSQGTVYGVSKSLI